MRPNVFAVVALSLILQYFQWQATAATENHDERAHTLTWKNNTGIPGEKDWTKTVYVFDGKAIARSKIEGCDAPEMLLKPGSTVHILIPPGAKLNEFKYDSPLRQMETIAGWIESGVKIGYHYKGRVVPSHVLRIERNLPKDRDEMAHYTYLDGKPMGMADDELPNRLMKLKWENPTILIVLFKDIGGTPVGMGQHGYVGDWDPLVRKGVKLETFVDEDGAWERFRDRSNVK